MSTDTTSLARAARPLGPVGAGELLSRLTTAFERAVAAKGESLALAVETIAVSPEALFHEALTRPRLVWMPPAGDAVVGLGAWRQARARGPQRIAQTRAALAPALTMLAEHIDEPGERPRAFAGFAFDDSAGDAPPWTTFGDARAIIPRWSYLLRDSRAQLIGVFDRSEVREVEAELPTIAEAIFAAARPRPSEVGATRRAEAQRAPTHIVDVERLSAARWTERIEAIKAEIAAGRCHKVVSAHRTQLTLSRQPQLGEVLQAMSQSHPSTTRFAFDFGGGVFLGATPERLISKRGATVITEALAGTVAHGLPEEGDEIAAHSLMHSDKDRGEHNWVLEAITAALGPWCDELAYATTPSVRPLRDVLHLQTVIQGRLQRPTHVLELVERLHPTPAVGGFPREAAMAFIAAHEATPRGWYASPIGWFDESGDGDFAVALRSGLLEDERAYLFAGAGIVSESQPDAELRETELKLRAVLDALTRP